MNVKHPPFNYADMKQGIRCVIMKFMGLLRPEIKGFSVLEISE